MNTLNRVARCIAEVLALSPEEIKAEHALIQDLGADSLDLVELMYLLEQEFSIRLSRDDVSLSAQLGLAEEEIHQEEVLTERALSLLRERFPAAEDILKPGATRKDLAALLTVSEIVRVVNGKLSTVAQ